MKSPFNRTSWLKTADATIGYASCKLTAMARYYAGLPQTGIAPRLGGIRRMLLIRPGGIGDMAMLLPAIAAVKRAVPDICLDVVCENRNVGVLKLAHEDIGTYLYESQPVRLLRALASNQYDVVIDTEQFHHFSALFAVMSRAPIRIGFSINPARFSLYTHLVRYDPGGYEAVQFGQLLKPLGLSEVDCRLHGILGGTRLPMDLMVRDFVREFAGEGKYVIICPGSSNPYKQWGITNFVAVMKGLIGLGLPAVLLGGAGDVPQCEALGRAASERSLRWVSLAGQLSLAQSAAVIRDAAIFVGCDSGPAHLATCLGTPSVTLFGPSDAGKWATADTLHQVVQRLPACGPCSMFGYNKLCRDVACMSSISPQEVLDACRNVLCHAASGVDRAVGER
jgi:ADP-heptose:LPS heptosyltransferase